MSSDASAVAPLTTPDKNENPGADGARRGTDGFAFIFPSLPGVSLRFEETSELKKLNNTENGRGLFSGKAVSLNLQGESQGKGWIKK